MVLRSRCFVRLISRAVFSGILLFPALVGASETVRPVCLQMQWKHCFQYAGYYAAIEQGYYAEAGIELTLREYALGTMHWDPVLAGTCAFGEMSSSIASLAAKGEPVVLLAAIAQHGGVRIAAREDFGIKNIHDLHGRRVMTWKNSIDTIAYLTAEGMEPGDYERVPHSYDPHDLIAGKVDAMMMYPLFDGFTLDQADVPIRYFDPQAGGIDFYGVCLYTTRDFLEKNPDLVRKFRNATLKGYSYALDPANLAEMVDLIRQKYAPEMSEAFLKHQARVFRRHVQPDYVEIGHINQGRWHHILEVLQQAGAAPANASLPAGFFYDPFPEPDYGRYLRLAAIGFALALLALLVAVPSVILNRRLRKQVMATQEAEEATRLANDHLAALLEERQQALTTLSHDLRKPLLSLQSYLDLLARGRLTPGSGEGAQMLSTMRRGTRNLSRRLDNLLDWIQNHRRDDSAATQPHFAEVHLRTMLQEVAELQELFLQEKQLQTDLQCPERLKVRTCEAHLQTILLNLMENAIKFSPPGGTIVCVASEQEEELQIAVRDDGAGFPTDQLAAWDSGQSLLPREGTRHETGRGLGLALCASFTHAIGGRLCLGNAPEGGAEIRLFLPRTD